MKASTKPASVHSRKSARAALDREVTPATASAAIGATHLDFADKASGLTVERVSGPGWELVRGDCLSLLRELSDSSVDVTITDPPYEAEAHEKGKRQNKTSGRGAEERGKRHVRVLDEEFDFPPITEAQRLEASAQIARVTSKLALVFCQVEGVHLWKAALELAGMKYRRAIPWVKPDAMPSLHGRWPGQAVEMIVLATHDGAVAPIGGKARYYECTKERGLTRSHPTAKPLELMRQIVSDFARPGEVVLDAFAGSGSTLIAATQLGRLSIGFEISPVYFDIACRRLRGDEAKPRKEQPSLFDSLNAHGAP